MLGVMFELVANIKANCARNGSYARKVLKQCIFDLHFAPSPGLNRFTFLQKAKIIVPYSGAHGAVVFSNRHVLT
jgi:hypothetical protein